MSLSYQELASLDQPIIIISHTRELKNWWLKVFNRAMYGDNEPDSVYFEDGVSIPLVQYGLFTDGQKEFVRPIDARAPYLSELRNCKLFPKMISNTGVVAYNGLSGFSRQGVNYMSLCLNPIADFNPLPYFKGNTYLFPLTEETRETGIRSEEVRAHIRVKDLQDELICGTRVELNRSLVLPSRESWNQLMDDLIDKISKSAPDDTILRRALMLAYSLQPFWLVKLSLDSVSRELYKLDFRSWVMSAKVKSLSDSSDLSVKVQAKIKQMFDALYGVDTSEIGTKNAYYRDCHLRLVSRMFLSRDNAYSAAG